MNRIVNYIKQVISSDSIGYVMVFAAGSLWGTIGFFVKLLSSLGADTSLIAFMRLFAAFIILIPIMLLNGGFNMFRINRSLLKQCLLLGILSQALFNYCYNISIRNVGVATSSILLYTSLVFVCIMSRTLFKEKIGLFKLLAMIINITGCFLMVTGGNLENLKVSSVGIIFGLAAAFLYSLVTIIGKIATNNVHPLTIVFYSFLFGWVTLGLITAPQKTISSVWGAKFWLISLGYGLIPTVASYLLYMGGLKKKIEISKAPIIASVETVVATLIGVIAFDERLGFINVLGIIILLSSIFIMNIKLNDKTTDANS